MKTLAKHIGERQRWRQRDMKKVQPIKGSCMKSYMLLAIVLMAFPAFGQTTATTEEGREVILEDTGQWYYADEDDPGDIIAGFEHDGGDLSTETITVRNDGFVLDYQSSERLSIHVYNEETDRMVYIERLPRDGGQRASVVRETGDIYLQIRGGNNPWRVTLRER